MKVCHVISGDLWAGAEMMSLRLLTGLCEYQEIELSAILMNDGILSREIRRLGIQVEIVDETQLDFFRAARRVREILGDVCPDILHTHRLKENILGFVCSRTGTRRIPLICTQHGLDEEHCRMKWRILSKANRIILSRYFRYIVAVSKDIQITLHRKFGFHAGKLVVIPNGTEIVESCEIDEKDRPFTIGSAGRLFPVKDFPFLVNIAAEMSKHVEDVRFELAGEGPEYSKLQEQIGKCGLQEVFFLKGFVDNMTGFYSGLNVYINTSLHEGSPMSVLEAMSHALPIIAPREGGIAEIVEDGLHGFLVEGRDPKRFSEKCLEIYRNRILGRRMGCAAKERILKEYSIRSMAERYFDLYKECISS